jgi:hypothetical protein
VRLHRAPTIKSSAIDPWRRFSKDLRVAQSVVRSGPEDLRREAGAFGEGAQLGRGEVGVDSAAEAAIAAGHDVLAAGDRGVAQDAVGDEPRGLRPGSWRG